MDRDLSLATEVLKDRLYFVSLRSIPKDTEKVTFFSVDNELVYLHFFNDFGPLNMGQLYRFCMILKTKLEDARGRAVYMYSSHDAHKRANAAFLLGGYLIMMMDYSPEDAHRPFASLHPKLVPFRDASYGPSTFPLTLIECLRGLWKGKKQEWVDFAKFNITDYETYERVENGDMNWILPGKFLAFSGPHNTPVLENGMRVLTPDFYVPLFRKLGVTTVIRLNRKCYDRKTFLDAGINHHELYFPDGSTPSDIILRKFLDIVENEPGAIAVHCKAGLGRTGTLIASYIMKHYRFTVTEVIAWIRICRPGSVIGPQQHYLQDMQHRLWKQGESFHRVSTAAPLPTIPSLLNTQGSSSTNSTSDSDLDMKGLNSSFKKLGTDLRSPVQPLGSKPRPTIAVPTRNSISSAGSSGKTAV
eukprot:TRINITY_DN3258_c0_g1_i1.p1 TRINITY_DN3258_c0_g1~~TRINITY_DN3258_c0_g1_i1.p1  ORF type:complete len:415 (+),score=44.40 TRINITY_DN3258_c0_g1_i1:119-1363(+)